MIERGVLSHSSFYHSSRELSPGLFVSPRIFLFRFKHFVHQLPGLIDGADGAGQRVQQNGLEDFGFVFFHEAAHRQFLHADIGAVQGRQLRR